MGEIMASIIARSCILSNPAVRRAVFNASRSANLSTTSAARFEDKGNIQPAAFKHKEKQKAYRVETGEMIYLKAVGGGRKNIYLFAFTCALTAFLCFESFMVLHQVGRRRSKICG